MDVKKVWGKVSDWIDEVAVLAAYIALAVVNKLFELDIPAETIEALAIPVTAYVGVSGAKAVAVQVAMRGAVQAADGIPPLRELRAPSPVPTRTIPPVEVSGSLVRLDDGRLVRLDVDPTSGAVSSAVVEE